MSDLEVRPAHPNERDQIQAFLKAHWNAQFSVVQSKELFDFLYKDAEGNITFLLGLRDGAIVATLGLINYDPAKDSASDSFLTLWVSIEPSSGVGLKLLQFAKTLGLRSLSSVGVRAEVIPFYRMLGYKSGTLDHHVIKNPDMTTFQILTGDTASLDTDSAAPDDAGLSLKEVTVLDANMPLQADEIYKSISYLMHRYAAHPIYTYRMFQLYTADQTAVAIAVARVVTANGASAMRWVDWIGDVAHFTGFSALARDLVIRENHEYADLYSAHLPDDVLAASAFVDRRAHDVIVPNYFEPFMAENEDKHFVTTFSQPLLFKGDGDADRPFRLNY